MIIYTLSAIAADLSARAEAADVEIMDEWDFPADCDFDPILDADLDADDYPEDDYDEFEYWHSQYDE